MDLPVMPGKAAPNVLEKVREFAGIKINSACLLIKTIVFSKPRWLHRAEQFA
jgi:hypothetical protein